MHAAVLILVLIARVVFLFEHGHTKSQMPLWALPSHTRQCGWHQLLEWVFCVSILYQTFGILMFIIGIKALQTCEMCVFLADQTGDGRTHLNAKFGYWLRSRCVTTALHTHSKLIRLVCTATLLLCDNRTLMSRASIMSDMIELHICTLWSKKMFLNYEFKIYDSDIK